MTKDGYYTSGEFAKKKNANVTLRTIRYYDRQGILKPSKVAPDNGYSSGKTGTSLKGRHIMPIFKPNYKNLVIKIPRITTKIDFLWKRS